jgi:hypothetical protein
MTEQETALYEAMTNGNWDLIDEMRQELVDDEARDQFATDYWNANAHYQADNEMSDKERVAAAAQSVEEENANAEEALTEEE